MPERPLLVLPAPAPPAERRKKQGGAGGFRRPGRKRQAQRLAPRFGALQQAFEARRAKLRADGHGIAPEDVVVLETVGSVEDFIRAVERVPGMEWLAEVEQEELPPDDDFFVEDRPDKALRGRLFMLFTNQAALQQMLALWTAWQAEQKLPHGLGRWRLVFEQLRDVRPWGVQDRLIETGVMQDWRDRIEHGSEIVPCEIELWYRQSEERRLAARDRVTALVAAQQGRIVSEAVIEEIGYHALLAQLRVEAIRPLIEQTPAETELVQCEQVQFFRASGQMVAALADGERSTDPKPTGGETPSGEPVVALLDGLPLQAHQRLEGRLAIDDPDGFEADYPAADRRHGTTMASLIAHADLSSEETPSARPLYVRPILAPDPRDWRRPRHETVPEHILVVDLIHRAVRRLFEGEGDQDPVAPDVAIINLSIGIRDRPFEGSLSPLARLIDWLAWRYKVLFVVSAGNHTHRIELPVHRDVVAQLARDRLQRHVVQSVAADVRHRRLLSPAEAVNVLTVGALDKDASGADPPGQWFCPYVEPGLPSPINAQGMGYRRSIKPEILAPGGRIAVQTHLASDEPAELDVYDGTRAPGQLAASPGETAGDTTACVHSRGTSNATALVSRTAADLYDVVQEIRNGPGGDLIATLPSSLWLKAMLAHGADWGGAGSIFDSLLRTPENTRNFREYVTRLLGYGAIDAARVRECTPYRVTALSGGELARDQSHVHRIPLPPSLSGKRGHRRLILTLAWYSPVNPRHQSWRRADVWFHPDAERAPKTEGPLTSLRVRRRQADSRAAQRGTLQHEILEGEQAAVFVEGDELQVQVSCRADAGSLEGTVPYTIVATLEVSEAIGVPIYDEVRVAVEAARVRV